MKKWLFVALVAIGIFSLTGCGQNSQYEETEIIATEMETIENTEEQMDSEMISSEPDTENEASQTTEQTETQEEVSADETTVDAAEEESQATASTTEEVLAQNQEEEKIVKMNVTVGNQTFSATLESNAAVDSIVQMMQNAPIVIEMSDYAGFEKVGPLGTSLPRSDSQTTTHAGDIVLYNGNQIATYYGTNSWSFTRLGKIDDLTGWEDALGSGDVILTFSVD